MLERNDCLRSPRGVFMHETQLTSELEIDSLLAHFSLNIASTSFPCGHLQSSTSTKASPGPCICTLAIADRNIEKKSRPCSNIQTPTSYQIFSLHLLFLFSRVYLGLDVQIWIEDADCQGDRTRGFEKSANTSSGLSQVEWNLCMICRPGNISITLWSVYALFPCMAGQLPSASSLSGMRAAESVGPSVG